MWGFGSCWKFRLSCGSEAGGGDGRVVAVHVVVGSGGVAADGDDDWVMMVLIVMTHPYGHSAGVVLCSTYINSLPYLHSFFAGLLVCLGLRSCFREGCTVRCWFPGNCAEAIRMDLQLGFIQQSRAQGTAANGSQSILWSLTNEKRGGYSGVNMKIVKRF